MNLKATLITVVFLAITNSAYANYCKRIFNANERRFITNGVENTTFSGIRKDLNGFVGNNDIGNALSNLTSQKGLRFQAAYITGKIGHGEVYFSKIFEQHQDELINKDLLESAIAEARKKAESSGKPILNISILVSRELKLAIFEEDQYYADFLYEIFFTQLMIEHGLTRQQLYSYKADLAGKVWYFVAQKNSNPDSSVIIYDPSK